MSIKIFFCYDKGSDISITVVPANVHLENQERTTSKYKPFAQKVRNICNMEEHHKVQTHIAMVCKSTEVRRNQWDITRSNVLSTGSR